MLAVAAIATVQMSHVATVCMRLSVCLCICVGHTLSCAKKRMNRSRCRLGADSCGSKELCVRWGLDPPREGTVNFEGDMRRLIATYLRLSALRVVRTNAFTAVTYDDTAMRPFA